MEEKTNYEIIINTFSFSSLEEQNDDLQKLLSYTAHTLEFQESEFEAAKQILETELDGAQEEVIKLTEKLQRVQNSHAALQRINQDLEDKLHMMAQLHEDKMRNLEHEVITLNNHLMEAKITIDKLTEQNELYRKDRNLAAQLLQCDKPPYRTHRPSENPTEFQERVCLHVEKPEPTSPPSSPVGPSLTQDASSMRNNLVNVDKFGQRFPYKADLYCSDTALYCPEERKTDRRQSFDVQTKAVEFFRTQSLTDGCGDIDSLQASLSSEHLADKTPSLAPTTYPGCNVVAEEKGPIQTETISTSTISLRDIHDRKFHVSQNQGNYNSSFVQGRPTQQFTEMAHAHQNGSHSKTIPTRFSNPLPASRMSSPHGGIPKLYNERRNMPIPEKDVIGHWRQTRMQDSTTASHRVPGIISACSHKDQLFRGCPVKPVDDGTNHFFTASYRDYFPDGEDSFQTRFTESGFGANDCQSSSETDDNNDQNYDKFPICKQRDARGDPKVFINKNSTNQTCVQNAEYLRKVLKEYVHVGANSSGEYVHHPKVQALELHHLSLDATDFNSKVGSVLKLGGLNRKDSLTKAQLYGNLLN
uniref:Si:dkey-174m14.3 n=1 Tax=Callorhinchus milii TaxID=7868 RepID=A0A4W3J9V1_CALMI